MVFFLLGALTIVEIMDAHKGFDIITKSIQVPDINGHLSVAHEQGCGIEGFILTSVIQGNLRPLYGISLWKALFVAEVVVSRNPARQG